MEKSKFNEDVVIDNEEPSSSVNTENLLEQVRRSFSLSLDLMPPKEPPKRVLDSFDIDGIVNYIKTNKCKNIVTMAGAGISTSAGIPDFRSPGSGLYNNLEKYNLPYPQAIFELPYFIQNPKPFFVLAKELYPGAFKPTVGHYFIRLLEEKGFLLRHYTQNIDTLERVAGINSEKLVEAHGTFHTSHCIECQAVYSVEWMKDKIFSDLLPICESCSGLVKPDIVFFGESLPLRFFEYSIVDLPKCDLLIIMGSSLVVQPFASLKDSVSKECPRFLINLEKVGEGDPLTRLLGFGSPLDFDPETNARDVFWKGNCDDGCQLLADKLGWGDELRELVRKEHERIDKENSCFINSGSPQNETIPSTLATSSISSILDLSPPIDGGHLKLSNIPSENGPVLNKTQDEEICEL